MADPPEVNAAIDIINLALLKLGLKSLDNIDEDNLRARTARGTYASIRNDVLRSHPWNFALVRKVASSSTLPTGSWDFDWAFNKPSGVLAVHAVEGQSAQCGDEWTIEGDLILTNLNSGTTDGPYLNTICIDRVTNVTKYDASFIDALAERLQAEWAEPLRQVTTLAEAKMLTSETKRKSAYSNDGKEATPRAIQSSTFINAR